MGDPAGVGPEVCLKALLNLKVRKCCFPIVIGDLKVLKLHAQKMGIRNRLRAIDSSEILKLRNEKLNFSPVIDLKNVKMSEKMFGKVRSSFGKASAEYIEVGVELVKARSCDAIVTGPIHKEAFNSAGYMFPGHTEFITSLVGGEKPVMMFCHPKLKIAHVSTHCSLKDALKKVKKRQIIHVGKVFSDSLQYMGFKNPRIGVAALNPHCGEGGLFGSEEIKEIVPAVNQLKTLGIDITGPISPDVVFSMNRDSVFDGVIAMYHDQGHIPGKMIGFNFKKKGAVVHAVNVTLGLPIIRTSVEHGTGFEIAGKGIASEMSMVDALLLASKMVRAKKNS
tara:strand:- start:18812 stop:19819 length:1008 start_codon:yes stop_codon:yes gene_type:complete